MLETRDFVIQVLVDDGRLDALELEKARSHASSSGVSVLDAIVALKICTAREIAITRAKLCERPFVDLTHYTPDIRHSKLLPRSIAERLTAFPLFIVDGVATVAMDDPLDLRALDQLRQALRMDIDPVLCVPDQLRSLMTRAYSLSIEEGEHRDEQVQAELTTGEEPIVAAVNQIIVSAIDATASDIHVNPDEHGLHLRYRVDGVLTTQQGPSKSMHAGLVQRLKVMAKLDLTQTRRPQDGKFRFQHRGQAIDIRLSIVPTVQGENVVMRLLRPAASIGDLSELMMPSEVRSWFEDMITRPHGMILVSGPTGSGKTTTLYTALHRINSPDVNIMTIEDPVEIRMPLIRQVQVNHEIGLDFSSALRSFLRQDPDVILVGEIRDAETARIAVQASLTGHLVFSTVHTNDACGTIARLRDLDVPAFAINNSLLCSIAQRLVRKVCEGCAASDAPSDQKRAMLALTSDATRGMIRGQGCGRCLNTGYRGRLGVYEMLRITPRVQEIIEQNGSTTQIRDCARSEGLRLMWEDGLRKAQQGLTTFEELLKLRSVIEVGEQDAKVAA
jgi:type IV pilus assembly protein PilB